jgi:hypothetical protein
VSKTIDTHFFCLWAGDAAIWFLVFHNGISFYAMMTLQQEEYERAMKLAEQILLQTAKG